MGSVSEQLDDGGMEEMEMDDLEEMEEMDDLDLGMSQEQTMGEKIKDVAFQDTSGKSLSSYDLEEYGFMPDSQGSRRILRAIDCAVGHLDTVVSDLILGLVQISKDLETGGA